MINITSLQIHLYCYLLDIWSAAETEFLLNKYEASTELVGPTKKFRYKKEMWDQLAKELNMVFSTRKTGRQCENRYFNVAV